MAAVLLLSMSCVPFVGGKRQPVTQDIAEGYITRLDPGLPEDQRILELHEHVKSNPSDYRARIELGRRWVEVGYVRAGEATLVELCRDNPDLPAAWNDLGRIYLSTRQYAEAKTAFKRAVRLDPNYAPAHYNLAMAMASNNEVRGVFDEYAKALLLDPSLMEVEENWHAVQNPWISIFKHYRYLVQRGQHLPRSSLPDIPASPEDQEGVSQESPAQVPGQPPGEPNQ